jgi:hypothetical protein
VLDAERGDLAIVHEVSRNVAVAERAIQMTRMGRPFAEERERGRFEQPLQVLEGDAERGRRVEDPRMGDHPQELVDAGPRKRPGLGSRRELSQQANGLAVEGRFLAPGEDEDVRVERDQRRPSIRSKRASRSSRRTPARIRPFSVRQRNS